MNVSREHIASAVRFSFGYTTKESEVSILLDNLKDVVKIFS
jgi:cysteine sulfinate desulfinase/cysteine desulfurase-like protein